jgi:hypothetical protein
MIFGAVLEHLWGGLKGDILAFLSRDSISLQQQCSMSPFRFPSMGSEDSFEETGQRRATGSARHRNF